MRLPYQISLLYLAWVVRIGTIAALVLVGLALGIIMGEAINQSF